MASPRGVSRRDLLTLGRGPAGNDGSSVHIASLLLQVVPSRLDALREATAALPGAELHATAHPGKFALVLESSDLGALAQATHQLLDVPGVLTVSIVSHLIEPTRTLQESIEDESPPVSAT